MSLMRETGTSQLGAMIPLEVLRFAFNFEPRVPPEANVADMSTSASSFPFSIRRNFDK